MESKMVWVLQAEIAEGVPLYFVNKPGCRWTSEPFDALHFESQEKAEIFLDAKPWKNWANKVKVEKMLLKWRPDFSEGTPMKLWTVRVYGECVREGGDEPDSVQYTVPATTALDARLLAFIHDGGGAEGGDIDIGVIELAKTYTRIVSCTTTSASSAKAS